MTTVLFACVHNAGRSQMVTRVREIREKIRQRVETSSRTKAGFLRPEGKSMPDLPVACTLSPEALRVRREGLLANLLLGADSRELVPDGLKVRFSATSETLLAITRAVDAERQCCRFLRFVMTVEPDGGPIVLDLSGPAGTREFLAALLEL